MYVRRTRRARERLAGSSCLAAVVIVCALAVAGCGGSKAKAGSSVQDCGSGKTSANVPVEVEIYRGTVSCPVAMTVEKSYAKAIVDGQAPGNGNGPVPVSGWTCEFFRTPQQLKTGDISKCVKKGTEILAVLKASG